MHEMASCLPNYGKTICSFTFKISYHQNSQARVVHTYLVLNLMFEKRCTYRVSLEKKEEIERHVQEILDADIIDP
jgi:hypothetical protein